jgi:hypothetical protein
MLVRMRMVCIGTCSVPVDTARPVGKVSPRAATRASLSAKFRIPVHVHLIIYSNRHPFVCNPHRPARAEHHRLIPDRRSAQRTHPHGHFQTSSAEVQLVWSLIPHRDDRVRIRLPQSGRVSKIRVVDKQISALIVCTDTVQPPATEGEGIRRGSSICARMREMMWSMWMRFQNLKIRLMFWCQTFTFDLKQKGIPCQVTAASLPRD